LLDFGEASLINLLIEGSARDVAVCVGFAAKHDDFNSRHRAAGCTGLGRLTNESVLHVDGLPAVGQFVFRFAKTDVVVVETSALA